MKAGIKRLDNTRVTNKRIVTLACSVIVMLSMSKRGSEAFWGSVLLLFYYDGCYQKLHRLYNVSCKSA
jgi:hypothetical protein